MFREYHNYGAILVLSVLKRSTPDVVLSAKTDVLHGQLSEAGTKWLCERMFCVYGDCCYKRLKGISVSHSNIRHDHRQDEIPTVPNHSPGRKSSYCVRSLVEISKINYSSITD